MEETIVEAGSLPSHWSAQQAEIYALIRPSSCQMRKSQNCTACSQVDAASWHRQKPPGIQLKGMLPFEHREVDFPEMKPH